MAEYHPELGLNKNDYFQRELKNVNKKYDEKLKNRSFFTSEKNIEKWREEEIKDVKEKFYGKSGGGFYE